MNIETMGATPPLQESDRNKIIEQVFERYHKDLIRWCMHKLKIGPPDPNVEIEAEEIVQEVYKTLLTAKTPIDLSRTEPEIRGFLNLTLNHQIGEYFKRKKAKKRNPEGGLVSLEEMMSGKKGGGKKGEGGVPFQPIQPTTNGDFTESLIGESETQGKNDKIEQTLKKLSPRMEAIIRKSYQQGKSDEEIAKDFGVNGKRIGQLRKRAEKIIRNIISGKKVRKFA